MQMGILYELYLMLDTVLIYPYRQFENPVAGFFVGTLVLCIWSILLGELTVPLALRLTLKHLKGLNAEKVKMHNLSLKALLSKDKASYQACNRQANEAFGRYFFAAFGLSAASLWPAPFALGWLATRFHGVELAIFIPLPFIGSVAGYTTVFIPIYILLRILWYRLKKRNGWGVDIAKATAPSEKMVHLHEIRNQPHTTRTNTPP
jgi:hypothetical protein